MSEQHALNVALGGAFLTAPRHRRVALTLMGRSALTTIRWWPAFSFRPTVRA